MLVVFFFKQTVSKHRFISNLGEQLQKHVNSLKLFMEIEAISHSCIFKQLQKIETDVKMLEGQRRGRLSTLEI